MDMTDSTLFDVSDRLRTKGLLYGKYNPGAFSVFLQRPKVKGWFWEGHGFKKNKELSDTSNK